MKLREICRFLDSAIPLSIQENYDNSGLQTGDPEMEIDSALLSLDVTAEVIEEAEGSGCSLVITHHPLIFRPLKSVTGGTKAEQILALAIKKDIAVYSSHTSLDARTGGVSIRMAEKAGLIKTRVLKPLEGALVKLVTFVPSDHVQIVRDAIFNAGAGVIGNYDMCSFNAEGYGTFRGNEQTNPFTGRKGEMHKEPETRIETILPSYLSKEVVKALIDAHPYEEVAYDLYPLANTFTAAGMGCIGETVKPYSEQEFLANLAEKFNAGTIRYSSPSGKPVRRVALCGGAGASLIPLAIRNGADAFVTGDLKYHDFLDYNKNIFLVDIGHYESEISSLEILHDLIIEKFPTFALRFSQVVTNPINHYRYGKIQSTGDRDFS